MTGGGRLPRASHAAVRDTHYEMAWKDALRDLDASTALECGELGVYIELLVDHDGTEHVRLHVPALGDSYESPEDQDEAIRRAVAAAARALELIEESTEEIPQSDPPGGAS